MDPSLRPRAGIPGKCLLFLIAAPLVAQDQQVQDYQAALEQARRVNLEFAKRLPNFVADEHAIRYKSGSVNPPDWQVIDHIDSEISVKGQNVFTREHVLVEGKPWNKPAFNGANWSVLFGVELTRLFDPKCNTKMEFDSRQTRGGRPVPVYRFQAAENGCFGTYSIGGGLLRGTKRFNPARTGKFYIEEPGGAFLGYEEEASSFPKGFGADMLRMSVAWDYVKAGESTELLPVAADLSGGLSTKGLWRVALTHTNHRQFAASTSVSFDTGDEPTKQKTSDAKPH